MLLLCSKLLPMATHLIQKKQNKTENTQVCVEAFPSLRDVAPHYSWASSAVGLPLSHSLLATFSSYLFPRPSKYTPDSTPLHMWPVPRMISQVSESATSLSPGLQRWHLYTEALLYHPSWHVWNPYFYVFLLNRSLLGMLHIYLFSVPHSVSPKKRLINCYILGAYYIVRAQSIFIEWLSSKGLNMMPPPWGAVEVCFIPELFPAEGIGRLPESKGVSRKRNSVSHERTAWEKSEKPPWENSFKIFISSGAGKCIF